MYQFYGAGKTVVKSQNKLTMTYRIFRKY